MTAIYLRIPDAIHKHGDKPMPLSELVSALYIASERTNSLRRLMRGLVHMGLFATSTNDDGEDAYFLAPTSRLLVVDESMAVCNFVRLILDPTIGNQAHVVGCWFKRPEEHPFELFHGKRFGDFANEKPWSNRLFNEGMTSDARVAACKAWLSSS